MAKVCLICGKICSGKTRYAKRLRDSINAVILSADEVTWDLIDNEQGEYYDSFVKRVSLYLRKKAVETVRAGANVILDWGFWTRDGRRDISEYMAAHCVDYEWHYIDINEDRWKQNIAERNQRIEQGGVGSDFYVNEGLLNKVLTLFEPPEAGEMDYVYAPAEYSDD